VRAGYHVTAIEQDEHAVNGDRDTPGLRSRLAAEGFTERVRIVTRNVLDLVDCERHDGIWTSCSWHYSINHRRPLRDFITVLQNLCAPNGVLGAEYMMPVEPRHQQIEHYVDEGEVLRYFPAWEPIWEAYTPTFHEAPHPGQPTWHQHRMGLLITRRAGVSDNSAIIY
jgi:hypothetical protein